MGYSAPSIPKAKDPLPPVVSRSDEATAISQTKQRKGALSTFLSKGGSGPESRGGFGDMFKKLLGE